MARMLVISRSKDVAEISKQALEGEGYSYTVQNCESFEESKKNIKESMPDLIFLDLDASELMELEQVLASPDTALIPVIVTAENDGRDTGLIVCTAALWAGARDYLLKPIDINELIEKVQLQMSLS